MSKKNAANNATFNATAPTDAELVKLERETIAKFIEVLPVWSQQLGPGLDVTFASVALLVKGIDNVATELEQAGASEVQIRAAALQVFAAGLAIPRIQRARVQKTRRTKELGRDSAKSQTAYDTHTIELVAEDFMSWYDDGGMPSFLSNLAGLVHGFGILFHEFFDDPSHSLSDTFFLSAFELRRRLDKVPPEVLGAIEMLGKLEAKKKAA